MSAVQEAGLHGMNSAYGYTTPNSNQENRDHNKVTDGGAQRSTYTARSPLSNLPSTRTDPSQNGQTSYQKSQDRVENMGQSKSKYKTALGEKEHNLYGRNGSNGDLSNAESDDIPENMYKPEKEDREGWIHREKLAKIENDELQAAGINLAKARSKGTETLRDRVRTSSRDRLRNDFGSNDGNVREEKRRKVSSPVPPAAEANEETAERSNWDLRSPEEIAADQANSQAYTTPVIRKSGSKIPVLSPSVSPAPADTSARETPVSRKRTMSGSITTDDGLYTSKMRSGSSKWNDDPATQSSKTGSPTKSRQPSNSGGASSASKSHVPRKSSTTKPSAIPPPNGRPRTRGNDTERPRTAVNPPEGDPPWLMDMYKPDPRLPPDQQLIPTLAKKQRQMEWEENGMVPKTYDRDFTPIAVHGNIEASNAQTDESRPTKSEAQDPDAWPLKPLPPVKSSPEANPKPNTFNPPATTGGYSTMPKVSSPPVSFTSPKIGSLPNQSFGAPSPNIGQSKQTSTAQQQSNRGNVQRLRMDDDDEKLQKKGCCCIVM